jgi:hypothetical protein
LRVDGVVGAENIEEGLVEGDEVLLVAACLNGLPAWNPMNVRHCIADKLIVVIRVERRAQVITKAVVHH